MNHTVMLWIGNGVSLIAAIFTIRSSLAREKGKIYGYQALQCLTMAAASVFFFSMSGVVTFILCAVRNALISKDRFGIRTCGVFLGILTAAGLLANNRGLLGLLPVFTTFLYTYLCYRMKTEKEIKVNITVNLILWAIYDALILDLVSLAVDTVSAAVTIRELWRLRSQKQVL